MSEARSARAGRAKFGAIGFTVLAVFLSVVFALLLYMLLAQKGYDQEQLRPIVVATKPLPAGQPLKPESLALKPWPSQSIPEDAFQSIEGLLSQVDSVPLHTILAGEVVVQSRLSAAKAGSGMAPLIPENMRGFAVRADSWLTHADMLYPGAVIDIVAAGRLKVPNPDGVGTRDIQVSKIVLQKVKVVAVNGAVDAIAFAGGAEKKKSSSRAVITLLVTPEQAEKLSLATRIGKLDFILRNTGDESTMETVGSDTAKLYNLEEVMANLMGIDAEAEESKAKSSKKRRAPRAKARPKRRSRSMPSRRSTRKQTNVLEIQ